jgi:hypothetical protein
LRPDGLATARVARGARLRTLAVRIDAGAALTVTGAAPIALALLAALTALTVAAVALTALSLTAFTVAVVLNAAPSKPGAKARSSSKPGARRPRANKVILSLAIHS